ncbi:MAG: methyltransferase domain-containing protein [Zoogloeaceae bacterium]|jgi:malonyl-CoA O-methyltransferase|nr:methyltransferase domain-containing protein [Zoogloeaceae bacterium]
MTGGVDGRALRRNVRRALPTLTEADFLSREVAARMRERLDYIRLSPRRVLDAGCGLGFFAEEAAARYPGAAYFGLDWTPEALTMAARQSSLRADSPALFLAARAEILPFPDASVDLLWANLLLPWLDDPARFFAEAARVLAPGGLLLASALGTETLAELREGFLLADKYGRETARTQYFYGIHALGDLLLAGGFSDPVVDRERMVVTYRSLGALHAEIKAAGAGCARADRKKTLSGRGTGARLAAYCAALAGGRADGRLPVTAEILYIHAWKPHPDDRDDQELRQKGARIHWRR